MPLLAKPEGPIVTIFSRPVAVWLYAINAVVALAVSFGLPLSTTQVAAITTIATALFATLTAAMTRPVDISAITGALATAAVAFGAFGLHLTADQIGEGVTVLSIGLALLLHQTITPAPALQRSKR